MLLMRILLLTAVLYSATAAQSFEWVNSVPLDIQTNPAYLHSSVIIDNEGDLVNARLVKSRYLYSITYFGDIAIEKRSVSGSLIWADTIFGKADVSNIITDGENNIICAGTYMDTIQIGELMLIYNDTGPTGFLLKLDSSGNPVWLKTGSEYTVHAYDRIDALAENGTNIFDIGTDSYNQSKILTLDENGNRVDSIVQLNVELINDIKRDKSGNTWVTGFCFSGSKSFNGLDTTAPFVYNEYVVKYNQYGEAQWVNFIRDITVQFYRIETDDSGNAYLSGSLFDSTSFGSLHAYGPQWTYDFFLTKIDPEGNFIWLKELPQGNSITGDATTGSGDFLSCRGNGQTFITGFFRGDVYLGNEVTLNSFGYYDIFVLSYDPDGEVLWAKAAGSDLYDQGSSIIADESGNCYITGMASANFVFDTISVTGGYYNLFLAKLNYETPVSVGDESAGTGSVPDDFILMQNYPNPFNPSTNVSFVIGSLSFVTLKVYDVLGNEVTTLVNEYKPAGTYDINFNASQLTSGVYFYRLKAGNFVKTRKLIVVK